MPCLSCGNVSKACGLQLACVDIHVITAPSLRLDRQPHRHRLRETARRLRSRLLLLDPLVRLHGVDENNAGEVAELLAYFRRTFVRLLRRLLCREGRDVLFYVLNHRLNLFPRVNAPIHAKSIVLAIAQ